MIRTVCVLLLAAAVFPALATAQGTDAILFEDPLDGRFHPGWNVTPQTYTVHPQHGKLFRLEHGTEPYGDDRPWAGNSNWSNYRVEVEILPEEGWSGLDILVSDDGAFGYNINFHAPDKNSEIVLEGSGLWGNSLAFKLWPVSQRTWRLASGEWISMRIDVSGTIANVYLDGATEPASTFHDLPFASGGVRMVCYAGSGYFRNLRITRLEDNQVQPVLADPWKELKADGVIRDWLVTEAFDAGYGGNKVPEPVRQDAGEWRKVTVDERGLVNLSALYPKQSTANVVFAKTTVNSLKKERRRCQLTYTDRFRMWVNGKEAFVGPPRGWFDPGREKYNWSRLLPYKFDLELPLNKGDNEILVRSEATEKFGWAFWVRLD